MKERTAVYRDHKRTRQAIRSIFTALAFLPVCAIVSLAYGHYRTYARLQQCATAVRFADAIDEVADLFADTMALGPGDDARLAAERLGQLLEVGADLRRSYEAAASVCLDRPVRDDTETKKETSV
jgi:hypothetical protein